MESKAALQRICSAASCGVKPSVSSRSECELTPWLSRGDSLILVLLLSLGLWALIWAAVCVWAAWGLRWA